MKNCKASLIIAVFDNSYDLTGAIDQLNHPGFGSHEISVTTSDSHGRNALAVEKVPSSTGSGIYGGVAAIIAALTAVGATTTGGVELSAPGPIVASFAAGDAGAASCGLLGGLSGSVSAKFY